MRCFYFMISVGNMYSYGQKSNCWDIHSHYDKLIDVLSKASINPDEDIIYAVDDFCDQSKDALKTICFLMSEKNLKAVIGNHDIYLQNWLYTGFRDNNWMQYLGGKKTVHDIVYRYKLTAIEKFENANWLRNISLCVVKRGILSCMRSTD